MQWLFERTGVGIIHQFSEWRIFLFEIREHLIQILSRLVLTFGGVAKVLAFELFLIHLFLVSEVQLEDPLGLISVLL